jgi:hypothetical protein
MFARRPNLYPPPLPLGGIVLVNLRSGDFITAVAPSVGSTGAAQEKSRNDAGDSNEATSRILA